MLVYDIYVNTEIVKTMPSTRLVGLAHSCLAVCAMSFGEDEYVGSKGFSVDEPLPEQIEDIIAGPDLVGAQPNNFELTGELSVYLQDYFGSLSLTQPVITRSNISATATATDLPRYGGPTDQRQDFFLFLFDGSATMNTDTGDPRVRRRTMAQCMINQLIEFPVEIPFPTDQIAIMQWFRPNDRFEFNELLHDFSSDEASLRNSLSRLGSADVTPIHEAVHEALMFLATETPATSYRAIFVFSDGLDNQEVPERPVIELAQALRIPIFIFGYNEELPENRTLSREVELDVDESARWGRFFDVLSSLTRQTGGRFFKGNRDAPVCPPGDCDDATTPTIWCDVVWPFLFKTSTKIDVRVAPIPLFEYEAELTVRNTVRDIVFPLSGEARSGPVVAPRNPTPPQPNPLVGQKIGVFVPGERENNSVQFAFIPGIPLETFDTANINTLEEFDIIITGFHSGMGPGQVQAVQDFVTNGGGVVAFTERGQFSTALDTLTRAFGGVGVGGDRAETTNVVIPDHPITNGPFGRVDNGANQYRPQLPGAFRINEVPENADVVALTSDGQAAIIALEATRALPACSGNVVLFNDVNFYDRFHIQFGGNYAALMNALNFVKRPLDSIPFVTVEQAADQNDPTNAFPVKFDVRFSVAGVGFGKEDVRFLGDAAVRDFEVVGSGTNFQILVTDIEGDGEVMPMVLAGAVTNATPRCVFPSEPSTSVDNRVFFDGTPPVATFTQTPGQGDPTNTLPIRFDVQFTEPVVEFDDNDADDVDVLFGGTADVTGYRIVPKKFDHLVNGGFETGTFEGWQVSRQAGSAGDFFIGDDSRISPIEMHATAGPASGEFYALTDQNGPTALALTQPLAVPVAPRLRTFLEFELFVDSWGTTNLPIVGGGLDFTVPENQYASVDILRGGAGPFSTSGNDVLRNFYRRVDPATSPNPYSQFRFEITDAVNAANGDVQFRLGMVANQAINGFGTRDFFNLGADNIRVFSEQQENVTDFTIEITAIAFPGTVTVTVPAGRAQDVVGNSALVAPGGDQMVLYDIDPPRLTISDPSVTSTLNGPADYTVTYADAASVSLAAEDVSLLTAGSATASVVVSTIDTFTRRVTLENIAGTGSVRIAIASGTARDAAGNLAPGATASAAVRVGVSGGSDVLSVDPPTLSFGEVIVGTSTDRSVIVESEADDAMTVRVETTAPYSIVTQSQFTLAPGESRMVAIRFSPTSTGVFAQQARMVSGGVELASVALTGTGAPAGAAPLQLSPADADVGFVAVGDTVTAAFRLLNRGTNALTGNLSIDAPFSIVGSRAFSLNSGQSQIVQVRITPTQVGDFLEALVVTSGIHNVSSEIAATGVIGVGGIEGVVTDGNAKAPVTCAAVGAFSGGELLGLALAAENGAYVFPALPAGAVTLRVWAPGFQTAQRNVAVASGTVGEQDFALVAGSAARRVGGLVIESGSGSGLGGVLVELLQNGVIVDMTFTCADGGYEIDGLPQGEYQVRFTAPDFQTMTNQVDLNTQADATVDATLLRDAATAGRLMGAVRVADAGGPVANAHVLIGKGALFFSEVTDGDGTFNAANLPPGFYTVIAAAEGFETGHAHITVFDGEPAAEVTISLEASAAPPAPEPKGCGSGGSAGAPDARGDVILVAGLGLLLLMRGRARRGMLEG